MPNDDTAQPPEPIIDLSKPSEMTERDVRDLIHNKATPAQQQKIGEVMNAYQRGELSTEGAVSEEQALEIAFRESGLGK